MTREPSEASRALATLLQLAAREGRATCVSIGADLAARGLHPASDSAVSRILNGAPASSEVIGAILCHVGMPSVARAAAAIAGGRFSAPSDAGPVGDVRDALYAVVAADGRAVAELTSAIADGHLTPAERRSVLEALDEADEANAQLRRTIMETA